MEEAESARCHFLEPTFFSFFYGPIFSFQFIHFYFYLPFFLSKKPLLAYFVFLFSFLFWLSALPFTLFVHVRVSEHDLLMDV